MTRKCMTWLVWVLVWTSSAVYAGQLDLNGSVVDKLTQKGIAGALVEIENASGGSGYSRTFTDEEGRFHFLDLPTGVRFHLTARAKQYSTMRMAYWEPGMGSVESTLRIVLPPGGVLEGRISDSADLPLPRVRMTLTQMFPEPYLVNRFERETDDDGKYVVEGIPEGAYRLELETEGYISEEISNVFMRSGKATNLNVTLYRPASIAGKVVLDDDGTPLFNVPVTALGPATHRSDSNLEGAFRLEDLRPGRYRISEDAKEFSVAGAPLVAQVSEGENIEGLELRLDSAPPKIRLAIYQDVYTLKEPIKFVVRGFNVRAADVELYHVPETWLLDHPRGLQSLLAPGAPLELFERVHVQPLTFGRFRPFSWSNEEVEIEKSIRPGVYLLHVAGASSEARHAIFISNLGLATKRGKSDLLVYAMNLETNQAEPGVPVYVLPKGVEKRSEKRSLFQKIMSAFGMDAVLATGQTDATGVFFHRPAEPDRELTVIAMKPELGVAVSNAFRTRSAAAEGRKALLYTDRPIYRPGQQVYYKAILKQFEDGKLEAAPRGTRVHIELSDPDGRAIFSQTKTSDEWGTVHGVIQLDKEPRLGDHSLSIKGFGIGNAFFSVQAYRKPDFSISVRPDRTAYVSGDRISVKIEARFFMGVPLQEAPIRYRVYERMRARPQATAWWEQSYYESAGYQRLIKQGSGSTDTQGFFGFEVTPGPKSYDRTITVEADVTSPSGRIESQRTEVSYEQSLYRIQVRSERSLYRTPGTAVLRIRVTDLDGKPVPDVPLRISMDQAVWNPLRRVYERGQTPLRQGREVTGPGGEVRTEIPLDSVKPGRADIKVTVLDPRGNRAVARSSLWVYSERAFSAEYDYRPLELMLDKDSYRAGETARLMIHSSIPDAELLFTVESEDILYHQRLSMADRSTVIEVPVKAEYAPNVYLSVLTHKGKKLHYHHVSLNVPVESRDFRIEGSFDRKEYRPGDVAVLTVKCSNSNDEPVSADLSVGIVDESLYSLRKDATPEPADFFFAKRPPWVSTSYSFPLRFIGGATKEQGDERVRSEFRDTALWVPHLVIGSSGKGTVELVVPDNLTTWRATLLGHTRDGRFGLDRARTLSSKPLVISLRVPRFLVDGDRIGLSAVLSNRTDRPLEHVRAELSTDSGVEPPLDPVRDLSMPPGGTARAEWYVTARDRFRTEVLAKGLADEASDAEKRAIPIESIGVPVRLGLSGWIQGGSGRTVLRIPESVSLKRIRARINGTSRAAAAALTAVPYLADFPYGCAEQTLNSFLPISVFLETYARMGIPVPSHRRIEARFADGIERLKTFIYDGSVRWGPTGDGDPYLTALAYFALSPVRSLGDEDLRHTLKSMQKALMRFLERERSPGLGRFLLFALTTGTYRNREAAERLTRDPDNMDPLDLALCMAIAARHGLRTALDRALAALERFQVSDPMGLHFDLPGSQALGSTVVEQNAFCLMALAEAAPKDSRLTALGDWLLSQKQGMQWESTRATGLVLVALAKLLEVRPELVGPDQGVVSVRVNGKPVGSMNFSEKEFMLEKGTFLEIDGQQLEHGDNVFSLSSDNVSKLYYAVQVDGFDERMFEKPESEHCTMVLDKTIHKAFRVLDSQKRPRVLAMPLSGPLHPGDEALIRLSFTADRDYRYFVLEDYLPAGFETVDFDAAVETSWWPAYQWKERHDQHVVYFLDRLSEGEEVRLEYVLRSESPGAFRVRPAVLQGFYHPRIRAISRSAALEVQR